jgi:hypothetical protein
MKSFLFIFLVLFTSPNSYSLDGCLVSCSDGTICSLNAPGSCGCNTSLTPQATCTPSSTQQSHTFEEANDPPSKNIKQIKNLIDK